MSVVTKARADNNTVEIRAVAVCEDGKCVMTEEDYKKLKEFVKETKEANEANDSADVANEILRGVLLSRLYRCEASQHKHIKD